MLVVFAGLAGPAGCGDNRPDTRPTASGIFPAEAFIGRRVRVELTGTNTHWGTNDPISVDFGSDIALGAVSVASETTLFVDLVIDDVALPGLHDVVITDGDETVTLTDAFLLQSPVAIHFDGNIAQGSIALFSITNHDFDSPFDTTSFQESIFEAPVFPNIAVFGPNGSTFVVDDVTPYTITGRVLIDVDATGSGSVIVASGPSDDPVRSSIGALIAIAPRACEVMTGPTATHRVMLPFDSSCFAYTPVGLPHAARFDVGTDFANASPRVAILPATGHFRDALATTSSTTQIAGLDAIGRERYYAIYLDRRGGSGYDFTLAAASQTLATVPAVEPDADYAAQPAHAPPILYANADLAGQTDVDWIKLDLPASAVGHHVHVITFGDPKTDTRVDVLDAQLHSLGGPSNDGNFQEDFESDVILAAGTYYVEIFASQTGFFDPAHETYSAAILIDE